MLGEHEMRHLAEDVRREAAVRAQLLAAQRGVLRRLAAEQAAPAEVLREIERDLDLESTRLGGL
jgi:hypothetical protein